MPRAFRVPFILSPKERADRRSVILKWVMGGAEALSSGGVVKLVPNVDVAVVRARAMLDVGLI